MFTQLQIGSRSTNSGKRCHSWLNSGYRLRICSFSIHRNIRAYLLSEFHVLRELAALTLQSSVLQRDDSNCSVQLVWLNKRFPFAMHFWIKGVTDSNLQNTGLDATLQPVMGVAIGEFWSFGWNWNNLHPCTGPLWPGVMTTDSIPAMDQIVILEGLTGQSAI